MRIRANLLRQMDHYSSVPEVIANGRLESDAVDIGFLSIYQIHKSALRRHGIIR
jgi:hypothetical protein